MAPRDLMGGLPDLDSGAPAGANLEFDPDFGELGRAAAGKPEQQYGGTVIPAEEPNWKEVASLADALLDRTRDIRVLVHLAVARLQLSGIAEFVTVLGAIRQQLEQRWEFVHPQLDPEDDNDPTFRSNALLQLADPVRVMRVLRTTPLAASRRDGAVSWRTISIFNGAIETDGNDEKKTETVIRAAFSDAGAAALRTRLEVFEVAVAELAGIDDAFNTHTGYGNGPDLSALSKQFREMAHFVKTYMPAEELAEVAGEVGEEPVDGEATPTGQPAPRAGFTAASLASINTREDAVRVLELVCRYYETQEPSSPMPLLIRRALKLAGKGFMEILQEIAPDGLMQAQSVVKSRDE